MLINRSKLELEKARKCIKRKDFLEAGISSSTIQRISEGKNVQPRTVGIVAKTLGVDVLDILEV